MKSRIASVRMLAVTASREGASSLLFKRKACHCVALFFALAKSSERPIGAVSGNVVRLRLQARRTASLTMFSSSAGSPRKDGEIEVILHPAVGHSQADDGPQLLCDRSLLGIDTEGRRGIVGEQAREARHERFRSNGISIADVHLDTTSRWTKPSKEIHPDSAIPGIFPYLHRVHGLRLENHPIITVA